jgi:hypothetical protein
VREKEIGRYSSGTWRYGQHATAVCCCVVCRPFRAVMDGCVTRSPPGHDFTTAAACRRHYTHTHRHIHYYTQLYIVDIIPGCCVCREVIRTRFVSSKLDSRPPSSFLFYLFFGLFHFLKVIVENGDFSVDTATTGGSCSHFEGARFKYCWRKEYVEMIYLCPCSAHKWRSTSTKWNIRETRVIFISVVKKNFRVRRVTFEW